MLRKIAPLALGAALLLAGCSEAQEALDQANQGLSKANACSKALGIVNLNPNVDPEKVQAEAKEKAQQLQDLGNQVADQQVKDTLFQMADGYLELEQQKLDRVSEFNAWLQRNMQNLENLRQACT